MAEFQPPPTYAEVVLVDERTQKGAFNPIWLKWFVDLAAFVSVSGGGSGGGVIHNDTADLQGGSSTQRYHLTQSQHTALTGPTQTYTPTLTNVTNVAASTAYVCQYLQLVSSVIVSGKVDIDATAGAGTASELDISLPIASNFTATEDCGGTAVMFAAAATESGAIRANAANNRAELRWNAIDTTNNAWHWIFMYRVL